MSKPSERDIARAREIESEILNRVKLSIIDIVAQALSEERASLPESVDWYLLNRCPGFIIEPYKAWKDGA